MFNNLRLLLLPLVVSVLAAGLLVALPQPPAAAKPGRSGAERIVSKPVTIPVRNTNSTSVLCGADGGSYQLRGRLVGTRAAVTGRTGAPLLNILVHDLGTGGWFWHLRQHPAYDYATRLAKKGQVSLVLDRLGYGESPLADGSDTCLGAQADMLHQVVQHVRSGTYSFAGSKRKKPLHAGRVVLHGHGTGAGIAQLEAGAFDDVDGLVLMSWTNTTASSLAISTATTQVGTCLRGASFAPYAGSEQDFRSLFLRTATAAVSATAAGLRSVDPCGDAATVAAVRLASASSARAVDAPVLLLFGDQDPRLRPGAAASQADAYASDVAVTAHTIAGASGALPLEASARATRALVLDWLRTTY